MGSPIAADALGGEFLWAYCPTGQHVEAAVNALMKAVKTPGRVWSPYKESYVRQAFRERVELAAEGLLKPPDEVGEVAGSNPHIVLYEIRWVGLALAERDPQHGQREVKVDVRLYYAEPPQFGLVLLGLHCHEKSVAGTPRKIRSRQDAEIDHAIDVYNAGMSCRWRLPELAKRP